MSGALESLIRAATRRVVLRMSQDDLRALITDGYLELRERTAYRERQRVAGDNAARKIAALRERVDSDLNRLRESQ